MDTILITKYYPTKITQKILKEHKISRVPLAVLARDKDLGDGGRNRHLVGFDDAAVGRDADGDEGEPGAVEDLDGDGHAHRVEGLQPPLGREVLADALLEPHSGDAGQQDVVHVAHGALQR